jgi:hypothetical protein
MQLTRKNSLQRLFLPFLSTANSKHSQAMSFDKVMENVPKPTSGDYHARSGPARRTGYNVREKILIFSMDLLMRLDIFNKLNGFLGLFHMVDLPLRIKADFFTLMQC